MYPLQNQQLGPGAGYMPQNQVGPQPMQQQGQYGYGQAPGGPLGYYEQQTPAGSFAAANQQQAQGAQPVQQQWAQGQQAMGAQPAQTQGAQNPFIGMQSQGVQGQGSVMPYAQQIAQQGQKSNPWLGQQSQQAQGAGSNPFGANNPFLTQAIDSASADATRNFQTTVQPAMAAAQRASGSFGNSAVGEMERNAYSDFGRNLGNIANSARMQDYTAQQQLAENALNRTQANNQFNSGLSAADLARNMAGQFQSQGLGMQGLGQQLGAAQFDASLGSNTSQFNAGLGANDLNRNSQLAQSLGQFNAGQMNSMGQFNANLGQQNSQFNAGQGNAMAQFNAGQGNQMGQFNAQLGQNNSQFNAAQGNNLNQFNTSAGNQMLENSRNRGQQMDQFNQGMDFQTWQANTQNMRQGQQDQLGLMDRLFGWNGLGQSLATQQQNTPMNYWQQFSNGFNQAGGLGGSQSQQLQGNPWLGAFGGWNAMGGFLGNGGSPRVGG